MQRQSKFLALTAFIAFLSSVCYGATITGTVKGADGAAVTGTFVQAQNTKTKMTFIALSDSQGHYRGRMCRPGTTGSRPGPSATAPIRDRDQPDRRSEYFRGHRADKKPGAMERDFGLSGEQAVACFARKGKIFANCFTCHAFQTRMASVRRDQDGWKDRVAFMRRP